MIILYNIGIYLFTFIALIISPFNTKAHLWVKGRKNWYEELKKKIHPGEKYFWIHCASLGEFEQGRPVIESVRQTNTEYKILLTFFSPSGYEIRKNYPNADIICYLPHDTPFNARKFIDLVRPVKVILVKYEFWNNYISLLGKREIPLFLISGIFRKDQHFFRWYGGFFRDMLRKFKWIYVQDEDSRELLKGIGIRNVTAAGDTRFDRVAQITGTAKDIWQLELFRGNEKIFLAGSSWAPDEEIIVNYLNRFPGRMKWVFAPHEIEQSNIERLEKLIRVKHVRFSQFNEQSADARVMIIDNIGMLSSAYRYASIAAVGGGFGKGIHNILEPASWGIPVMFGPGHKKFREAVELLKENGAGTFDSFTSFTGILEKWLSDEAEYLKSAKAAGNYITKNIGATRTIMQGIMQKDINTTG